jgi:hypothetical protein
MNHGFDTSLAAYDFANLGWTYERLDCLDDPSVPYLACDPGTAPLDPAAEAALRAPGSSVTAGYVATPAVGASIELRKIYNTRMFAKGNQGHPWSRDLDPAERDEVIEYLKTL